MKALLLMRHAKSSWKDRSLPDHDRPLKKRGRRAAPRMGQLLADEKLVPALVLTSSALRTIETGRAVTEACGYEGPVHALSELYLAAPESYDAALQKFGAAAERILVIGHNPGLEALVDRLCGRQVALPTAAIVLVHLPIESWAGVALDGHGTLERVWTPKTLD